MCDALMQAERSIRDMLYVALREVQSGCMIYTPSSLKLQYKKS